MSGELRKPEGPAVRIAGISVYRLSHPAPARPVAGPTASCTKRPRAGAQIEYAMDRIPTPRRRAGSARPAHGEHAPRYRQALSPVALSPVLPPHPALALGVHPHQPVLAQSVIPVPARPTRASARPSLRARPTSRCEAARNTRWFAAPPGRRVVDVPVWRIAATLAQASGHSVARNAAADGRPGSFQPRPRWPRRIGRDLDAAPPRGDATPVAVPAGYSLPQVRVAGSPRGSRWAETRGFKNLQNVMRFTKIGALLYDRRLVDFVQLVSADLGGVGGLCRESDCCVHSARVCTSIFSVYPA